MCMSFVVLEKKNTRNTWYVSEIERAFFGREFILVYLLRLVFRIALIVNVAIMIGSYGRYVVCHTLMSCPVIVGQFVNYYYYHDSQMSMMFAIPNPMTNRHLLHSQHLQMLQHLLHLILVSDLIDRMKSAEKKWKESTKNII